MELTSWITLFFSGIDDRNTIFYHQFTSLYVKKQTTGRNSEVIRTSPGWYTFKISWSKRGSLHNISDGKMQAFLSLSQVTESMHSET